MTSGGRDITKFTNNPRRGLYLSFKDRFGFKFEHLSVIIAYYMSHLINVIILTVNSTPPQHLPQALSGVRLKA